MQLWEHMTVLRDVLAMPIAADDSAAASLLPVPEMTVRNRLKDTYTPTLD